MSAHENDFAGLLEQYQQDWLDHVARLEHRMQLMVTLKQGMELLLLVCSFLIFYLIDCNLQILALPIIR